MRRRCRDARRTRFHCSVTVCDRIGQFAGTYRHCGVADRLARVVRPAPGGLASSAASDWQHALSGCDATQGIVSVDADTAGNARVWRRDNDRTEVSEYHFPNWFLTTSLEPLAHLSAQHLTADELRASHGQLHPAHSLSVVELDWSGPPDEDVYRYLILTSTLDEIG